MKSLIGHVAAGITGSAIAGVAMESGGVIVSATLIALCLCFVGVQLMQPGSRP